MHFACVSDVAYVHLHGFSVSLPAVPVSVPAVRAPDAQSNGTLHTATQKCLSPCNLWNFTVNLTARQNCHFRRVAHHF